MARYGLPGGEVHFCQQGTRACFLEKEPHARELAELHVLNNAWAARILSADEERRLFGEWQQKMVAKGLLTLQPMSPEKRGG